MRPAETPFISNRSIMRLEMVETVSNRRSSQLSMRSATRCRSLPFNNPIRNATSISKSCRCNQDFAP